MEYALLVASIQNFSKEQTIADYKCEFVCPRWMFMIFTKLKLFRFIKIEQTLNGERVNNV